MTIKELQQYAKEQGCSLLCAADDCWCRLDERTRNAIGSDAVYVLSLLSEDYSEQLMEVLYECHEEIFEEEEGEK